MSKNINQVEEQCDYCSRVETTYPVVDKRSGTSSIGNYCNRCFQELVDYVPSRQEKKVESHILQRGNQVVRFLPSLMTIELWQYKNGEWSLIETQKKNEMFMLRNNWKYYVKEGFLPKK